MPVTASATLAQRLWAKVDKRDDGCWIFTGYLLQGYGRLYFGGGHRGRVGYAHRIAYELLVGEVPEGRELDHLCRNRACVNPTHLELVTHRENLLRGETFTARQAAVTSCPAGHEYTPENTYTWRGHRSCRICRAAHFKAWAEKHRGPGG